MHSIHTQVEQGELLKGTAAAYLLCLVSLSGITS